MSLTRLEVAGSVSIHALLAESDSRERHILWHHIRFNPRPPCGERRSGPDPLAIRHGFQSTPSLRRATLHLLRDSMQRYVSIHALLAESDAAHAGFHGHVAGFNPRPPCGERLLAVKKCKDVVEFQSTPSLRRATSTLNSQHSTFNVSIHALLAESDRVL